MLGMFCLHGILITSTHFHSITSIVIEYSQQQKATQHWSAADFFSGTSIISVALSTKCQTIGWVNAKKDLI